MAATVGNESSLLRGRWAISEGISELKKRDCKIKQKLGRIRQKIRHFPVVILRADLYAEDHDETDDALNSHNSIEVESAKNDSLPCELGLRYPLLQSIMAGRKNHQTIQVRLYRIQYRIRYCMRYRVRYEIRNTISYTILYAISCTI